MTRYRSPLAVVLVVLALAAGPMVAAADTTTLTVAVETRDGAAVAGATIVATWDGGSSSATTANNGKAFVDVPEDERVELIIEHENYTRNFPYVVRNPGGVSGEVHVPVAAKTSLDLTVRDSEGVVPDARVQILWNGRLVTSQQTADDGTLSLDTVETGTYGITVEKPGYFINETDVHVANDDPVTMRLKSGSVPYEFNVTDAHFDPPKPVAQATITIDGVGTFNTSSDGLATARIPVNSEVDVSITKSGYETVSRTFDVNESGDNVAVDLQRTPGLTITAVNDRVIVEESVVVTVRNEYDEPVENATVHQNGSAVATTNQQGQAIVPLDTAGTAELDATRNDLVAPSITVDVIDPDATTTTTTTTPTTTQPATTTATDEPSNPVEDTTGIDVPGFGLPAILLALLATTLLVKRRR